MSPLCLFTGLAVNDCGTLIAWVGIIATIVVIGNIALYLIIVDSKLKSIKAEINTSISDLVKISDTKSKETIDSKTAEMQSAINNLEKSLNFSNLKMKVDNNYMLAEMNGFVNNPAYQTVYFVNFLRLAFQDKKIKVAGNQVENFIKALKKITNNTMVKKYNKKTAHNLTNDLSSLIESFPEYLIEYKSSIVEQIQRIENI